MYELYFSSEYKLSIDPNNNVAINISYFSPYDYTLSQDFYFDFID